jgi:hypothetical protein
MSPVGPVVLIHHKTPIASRCSSTPLILLQISVCVMMPRRRSIFKMNKHSNLQVSICLYTVLSLSQFVVFGQLNSRSFISLLTCTMDDGTYDPDNGGPSTEGIAGLDMNIGSIVAPSASLPDLAPRISGGKAASYAHVNDSGRDTTNGGDGGDDDDIDRLEEDARRSGLERLKQTQEPKHYGPADRVLSDDVFRQLVDSNIKDFEEEHAHIDKHYSIGSRPSFSNVKCSPHAVQVISDAFEDFLMKLLNRAHVFFSARVRSQELLEELTLKSNTFGPDHRMLINMRICNESEIKRKRERDMIESVQKQREEEAAAEDDGIEDDELQRHAAERVEQKKANSKTVTMEEVNREREIMARKGGQGLLVKSYAVKALESFASTGLGVELEKTYNDTELFFKKISEHPLSGQEVSNVHEIQAEIKKNALRKSRLQESEWRALRLDDLVPVLDAEPTLRRKMVTLYGHELVQSKNNSIVQEELKRRRDAASLNEEKEDQWNIIKKLCRPEIGSSDESSDALRSRLEGELTLKHTQNKLVLPAAISYHKCFIENGSGKDKRKVHSHEHRSSSITSMLSSKVAVQRLPQGVTREDVESFLTRLNVDGLKNCQFDSHGTNAVLEFHMPQFAQDCVTRVDAQRMRPSDSETLKVSLYEATKLEPGNILIAERYQSDVSAASVQLVCKNFVNFKGTCKPQGATYCFVEFLDSLACASALNKAHALVNEIYFRYVSNAELLEFFSAREKERQAAMAQIASRPLPKPVPSVATVESIPAIFLTASGIPFDMSPDQLKQRMSLYSGCLVHTLRNREFKVEPSSSLRFQELQVEFADDQSAIECQKDLNGRPFMDNRAEYGPVKVGIKRGSKSMVPRVSLTAQSGGGGGVAGSAGGGAGGKLPQDSPVVRPIASDHAGSSLASSSSIVSSNTSSLLLQNSADLLTFLVVSNIPMIPKEDVTSVFLAFPGLLGRTKVEIRDDPKLAGCYSVRCLFVDVAHAQRCLDAIAGRPFNPQHDVGPVRGYIKQVSKDLMMQERLKKKPVQVFQPQQMPGQTFDRLPQQPVQQPHIQLQMQMEHTEHYGMSHSSLSTNANFAQPPMQPIMQQPMMQQPMMQQPMMQQPVMQQPLMQQPVMQQPLQPNMQYSSQPSQGQQQHMMSTLPGGISQNLGAQSHPQLMAQHTMPPASQPHQYYQQQVPMHIQQQQYAQVSPQQMQQQTHQYSQAQHFPMQHGMVQHMPFQHYGYQQQQPAVQYMEAASPTAAAELQRLDEEARGTQERLNQLQRERMAGSRP